MKNIILRKISSQIVVAFFIYVVISVQKGGFSSFGCFAMFLFFITSPLVLAYQYDEEVANREPQC